MRGSFYFITIRQSSINRKSTTKSFSVRTKFAPNESYLTSSRLTLNINVEYAGIFPIGLVP